MNSSDVNEEEQSMSNLRAVFLESLIRQDMEKIKAADDIRDVYFYFGAASSLLGVMVYAEDFAQTSKTLRDDLTHVFWKRADELSKQQLSEQSRKDAEIANASKEAGRIREVLDMSKRVHDPDS